VEYKEYPTGVAPAPFAAVGEAARLAA
jgi:hypothetical protein